MEQLVRGWSGGGGRVGVVGPGRRRDAIPQSVVGYTPLYLLMAWLLLILLVLLMVFDVKIVHLEIVQQRGQPIASLIIVGRDDGMIVLVMFGGPGGEWIPVRLSRAGTVDRCRRPCHGSVQFVAVTEICLMSTQRTSIEPLLVVTIDRVVGIWRRERFLFDLDAESLFRTVPVTDVLYTCTCRDVRVEGGARGTCGEVGDKGWVVVVVGGGRFDVSLVVLELLLMKMWCLWVVFLLAVPVFFGRVSSTDDGRSSGGSSSLISLVVQLVVIRCRQTHGCCSATTTTIPSVHTVVLQPKGEVVGKGEGEKDDTYDTEQRRDGCERNCPVSGFDHPPVRKLWNSPRQATISQRYTSKQEGDWLQMPSRASSWGWRVISTGVVVIYSL
jgi:hypothetical protein